MYSGSDKCFILLLTTLLQGGAFASVNGGSVGKNGFTHIIANFQRVAFIHGNVSHSLEDSSPCRGDIARVFEGAINGERWALQMVDATSGLPSGILRGNIHDLGMYDECVEVVPESNPSKIQGQHCMVSLSMSMPSPEQAADILYHRDMSLYNIYAQSSMTTSICVPTSCGIEEIAYLLNTTFGRYPSLVRHTNMTVAKVTCSPVGSPPFTLGEVLTISFLAGLVFFVAVATACDYTRPSESEEASNTLNILAKFSARKSLIVLLSTKSKYSSLSALGGIRFLCMCFVILGHRGIAIILGPHSNVGDIANWMQSPRVILMFLGVYISETFFVLSGFLRAYFLLKILNSKIKYNIIADYVHRYIRITPGPAVMILLCAFVFHRFGSGPLWETLIGLTSNFARENWWNNILYIQNFVNPEQMFFPHFWYLAVDMQLYWISPFIIYPMYRWPKLGLTILGLTLVASVVVPCIIVTVYRYAAIVNLGKDPEEIVRGYVRTYIPFYNRATSYLVGIYAGYDVFRNKRSSSKATVTICWIVCCVAITLCLMMATLVKPFANEYNLMWELIYVAIARPAWGLASAWVIYACVRDHGGILTKFLTLPFFLPLSRLAYSMYLVHFAIIALPIVTMRSANHITVYEIVHFYVGDVLLAIVGAVIMEVFVYSPVIVLQDIVHSKQRRQIAKMFPDKEDDNANADETQNSPALTTKC